MGYTSIKIVVFLQLKLNCASVFIFAKSGIVEFSRIYGKFSDRVGTKRNKK
jgi:hypothetical protein